MRMTKGRLGFAFISLAIALSLDQLLRFGYWEWWQMVTPWHHEGLAVTGVIAGTALLITSRRSGQHQSR